MANGRDHQPTTLDDLRVTVAADATAFLEAAPDAMVIVRRDGRILFANGQAERLFGYPRDELIGQLVDVLVPARYRGAHPGHRAGFFDTPRARPMGAGVELYAVRKDGTEFPAEISLGPVATAHGSVVSAAIRDVTERNRVAQARAELAAIVDSSDDAIIAETLDGMVRSWNRGAERIFGYTAAEMIGRPVAALLPPGRVGEGPTIIAQLLRGDRVAPFESVRRRKDGQDIDVSVTISLIRDVHGQIVGASKVARDISDRKRAERALAAAKEATDVANRELEAFSYSVAHDLRAPLRGIDGFSLALLEDCHDALDATGQRYLRRVRELTQHMAQLIESLLSLARITRGELRHERVDLGAAARATVERLRTIQPDRQVEVGIADDLIAWGDGRLLGVALDNLLGNAWKFTRDHAAPRIELGAGAFDGARTYFVRDNGAGFDMAHAAKLFGVFQRLHSPDQFEGTGIGLATVQRIIRRHGGRIWADGAVGAGATFYFTVPTQGPPP
ncbi:MAG: PAS domain S-box protein [Myxococcales bacterium]|nr:PAS domain S-box protein [Myxococcales bacterium]